jgi:hypothetical protein
MNRFPKCLCFSEGQSSGSPSSLAGLNVAGQQCDYKREQRRDLPEIGDRRQQPELD